VVGREGRKGEENTEEGGKGPGERRKGVRV